MIIGIFGRGRTRCCWKWGTWGILCLWMQLPVVMDRGVQPSHMTLSFESFGLPRPETKRSQTQRALNRASVSNDGRLTLLWHANIFITRSRISPTEVLVQLAITLISNSASHRTHATGRPTAVLSVVYR